MSMSTFHDSRGPLQDANIRSKLIELMYARARSCNTVLIVLGAVTVAFFVHRNAPWTWIAAWFFLLCALTVIRFALVQRYYQTMPGPHEAERWGIRYAMTAVASGSMWGSLSIAVYMFLPPDSGSTIFVQVVFAGYVSASVTAIASYMPACYGFMLPMAVALLVGLVSRGDGVHMTIAAFTFMYFVFTVISARKTNRSEGESIALRFENAQLVEELIEKRQLAEQAREAAEQANTAKSKFLAVASHDLRQPLHALTLFVGALEKRVQGTEAQSLLENMTLSLDALHSLFNALLDVSRLDAGVIRPRIGDFRLQELLDRLKNGYEPEARQKGLALHCPQSDLVIRSDRQLLERILRNYLSNAIRYTDKGHVSVRAVVQGDVVRIEVSDSGKGISRGKHQEIFREFHQLENPERDRSKGLGLGLAIVDRLSRLLNHPIGVESEPGRGSSFSISVPLGDPVEADRLQAEANAASTVELGAANVGGMLVLVIDDERGVREGTAALLKEWGCDTLLVSSEKQAIEELDALGRVPSVIIADYRLAEGRTGALAIRQIQKKYGEHIPGVIITGDTAPDRLNEAAASGYQLFHKPVPPPQLRALLSKTRAQALASTEKPVVSGA